MKTNIILGMVLAILFLLFAPRIVSNLQNPSSATGNTGSIWNTPIAGASDICPVQFYNVQIVLFCADPQTVGTSTLKLPDMAGTTDYVAMLDLDQTFSNKTISDILDFSASDGGIEATDVMLTRSGAGGLFLKGFNGATRTRLSVEPPDGTIADEVVNFSFAAIPGNDYKALLVRALQSSGLFTITSEAGGSSAGSELPIRFSLGSSNRLQLSLTNTVVNESGADMDFRMECDIEANCFNMDSGSFSGRGAFAFGGTVDNNRGVTVKTNVTNDANQSVAIGGVSGGIIVLTQNGDALANWTSSALTVATGASAFSVNSVAGFRAFGGNITKTGTGTITNAAAILVDSQPTIATNNYALWIDNGDFRNDGRLWMGVTTPSNVTDSNTAIITGGVAMADDPNSLISTASHGTGSTTLYIGNATIDTTVSDERLKTNIRTATTATPLLRNLASALKTYDFAASTDYAPEGDFTGFLAQQLNTIAPQFVKKPHERLIPIPVDITYEDREISTPYQDIEIDGEGKEHTVTKYDVRTERVKTGETLRQTFTDSGKTYDLKTATTRVINGVTYVVDSNDTSTWSVDYKYLVPYILKGWAEQDAILARICSNSPNLCK